MRKYKRWARHSACEPYLGEIIESPFPDWSELERYRGKWVGIKDRHVVASGTVEEVLAVSRDVSLFKVPATDNPWFFHVH